MLVSVDTSTEYDMSALFDEHKGIKEIKTGIYINVSHNFHLYLEKYELDEYPLIAGEDEYVPCYGVVDSPEQFIDMFYDKINSRPNKFVVGLTEVRKDEEYPTGGWRWHKWGEYLGVHEITHEYLYDEPIVEVVWCFHVIEIKNANQPDKA